LQEIAMTSNVSQIIRDQHASLAAVLRSLTLMIDRGPSDEPERFFDVLRAMLFYIDEFPERQHHPKETELLFPRLKRLAPQLTPVIEALDADHAQGERRVRELQHLLLAWELVGDSRRLAFLHAVREYVRFYLEHMRVEETQLLPVAQRVFQPGDWAELDAAFISQRDPLDPELPRDPNFDRLFTRIVMTAPAPIGLGRGFASVSRAA
jgi:hemerythrin-like domain-containing protein